MHGKIALVTGGSRGIGEAIVKKLVNEGFFVIFTYLKNRLNSFIWQDTLKKRIN